MKLSWFCSALSPKRQYAYHRSHTVHEDYHCSQSGRRQDLSIGDCGSEGGGTGRSPVHSANCHQTDLTSHATSTGSERSATAKGRFHGRQRFTGTSIGVGADRDEQRCDLGRAAERRPSPLRWDLRSKPLQLLAALKDMPAIFPASKATSEVRNLADSAFCLAYRIPLLGSSWFRRVPSRRSSKRKTPRVSALGVFRFDASLATTCDGSPAAQASSVSRETSQGAKGAFRVAFARWNLGLSLSASRANTPHGVNNPVSLGHPVLTSEHRLSVGSSLPHCAKRVVGTLHWQDRPNHRSDPSTGDEGNHVLHVLQRAHD